jgi:hypothetical protein
MRTVLALASTIGLLGCRRVSFHAGEWAAVSRFDSASIEAHGPGVVSDGELKSYLPERLGDRLGAAPHGSMTRMGERALSEVSRSYPSQGNDIELQLSDARLSPQVAQAISAMGGNDQPPGLEAARLVLPGAVGYARYDESERTALAQVVIAGRFVASATVSGAEGPDDAVAALRSLDTLRLARVAQAQ